MKAHMHLSPPSRRGERYTRRSGKLSSRKRNSLNSTAHSTPAKVKLVSPEFRRVSRVNGIFARRRVAGEEESAGIRATGSARRAGREFERPQRRRRRRVNLLTADIATRNRQAVSVFLELTYHSVGSAFVSFRVQRDRRSKPTNQPVSQPANLADGTPLARPAVHSDARAKRITLDSPPASSRTTGKLV